MAFLQEDLQPVGNLCRPASPLRQLLLTFNYLNRMTVRSRLGRTMMMNFIMFGKVYYNWVLLFGTLRNLGNNFRFYFGMISPSSFIRMR